MHNVKSNVNGSAIEFFELLNEMRGISPISAKLLNFLDSLQVEPKLSNDAKKVLLIYFSLLDEGNIITPLDSDALFHKWSVKWQGLQILTQKDDVPAENFKTIIKNGCKDILSKRYTSIISSEGKPLQIIQFNGADYLCSCKHVDDRKNIENIFKADIFKEANSINVDEISKAQKFVDSILKEGSEIKFDEHQAEAVARGIHENLVITGGPGTGKTTVIGFLLWKLFSEDRSYLTWSYYMAAPSGKAADRLVESLDEFLAELSHKEKEKNADFVKQFNKIESYTIHRLLKYNPNTNRFTYNADNPLPEKSIYIIDEASMIDVSLFSALMQALPKNGNFKIFILGDPDQLPSVDAGAVLGNILQFQKNFVVKLVRSNRFNESSDIGQLALKIQKGEAVSFEGQKFNSKDSYWDTFGKINYFDIDDGAKPLSSKEEAAIIEGIVKKWASRFYNSITELASHVDAGKPQECQKEACDLLWNSVNTARILSAERRGNRGVEYLNKIVNNFCAKDKSQGGHFVGQILMLNQNQHDYKLYNGDTGVVIKSSVDEQFYLMFKKRNGYTFFPLTLLPTKAIEPAFAITIHKSQGSGYPNIMMFLPKQKGHPLLNREILYTGVTRTKRQGLTIIATPETFKAACCTVTERETGIKL